VVALNVSTLERFSADSVVDEAVLRAARLVQPRGAVIKFIGDAAISTKLTVHGHKFSKSAVEMIEKAGGTVVVLQRSVSEA
jgi:large subunit ribosomal protein L15